MKKFFISVPIKLLGLIISTLLIISLIFSQVSLQRIQEEFQKFQEESLKNGQENWDVHSNLLSDQLRTWLESFSDMILKSDDHDLSNIQSALIKQYDTMQLHLNVENLWFVDEADRLLFQTATLPNVIHDKIRQVLVQQVPVSEVYCDNKCSQLVIIPLFTQKGELGAMAVTASLVDMLYSMKRTLQNEVAIVSIFQQKQGADSKFTIISASNTALIRKILSSQAQTKNAFSLATKQQYQVEDKYYLFNLLPLAQHKQARYYLALIDDVTQFKIARDKDQRQLLYSITVIFLLLAGAVYLITSPSSKRLLALVDALPLLAKKQFKAFRQARLDRRHIFADELDLLADSAIELSYELEQLNLEIEQKTKELENIAMYDLLTGLPNRNMLNYQLSKAIANLSYNDVSIAVLFLDLDDFKKVNDSHGHADGDKLLIEAANRIRLNLRQVDMVCRFGGDEFVIFLDQVQSLEQVKFVANKILQHFKQPIKIASNLFYISTSIGIAYTNESIVKADDLIRQADIAMYEAKSEGGGRYFVYKDEMFLKVAQQVMLETEVRQALAKSQFSLSLQPQISAINNKLYGFEALLRWHHPDRGMVSPDDFIPILEKSEYMIELGYWVIRRCFELAIEMKKRQLDDIKIAINLSAGQFLDQNLTNYLSSLIREFDISAGHFELELTEQTLVKDIDLAIEVMHKLKAQGFTFAIDDFGTGYSSLAYLKDMPVDVIKIDKSFVFGMLDNHADYKIIKSIIAMVKSLGLMTVAEGVETSAQLRSLKQLECDLIQGYYYAKPIPELELFDFIAEKLERGFWKTKIGKVS